MDMVREDLIMAVRTTDMTVLGYTLATEISCVGTGLHISGHTMITATVTE